MQTTTENPSPTSTTAGQIGHIHDGNSHDERHARRVRRAIRRWSFATLATTSPAGRPHVAGVVYQQVGDDLWVHTDHSSRKGRNVADNPNVAMCIPFRRLPVGPPFTVQFQATAEIVAMDDAEVVALLEAGALKKISGHGALDKPDGCFLRIRLGTRVHTFGYGVRVLDMARQPLDGGRSVHLGGRIGGAS